MPSLDDVRGHGLHSLAYTGNKGVVVWSGHDIAAGEAFDGYLQKDVAERLFDISGKAEFAAELSGLVSTGFGSESLAKILASETPEERDWAAGEALAEAWLSTEYGVDWPWNMELDKRTPRASLPGADLVGFAELGAVTHLAIGEVKSSTDKNAPPNVMNGRSGMSHQLETLASDLELHHCLLRWLMVRCKNTKWKHQFDAAVGHFLESGNKAIMLFGVLVRDTSANELDLKARGLHLADQFAHPTDCKLIALYLPCALSELPKACEVAA